ncbi:MAG: A24 family peptidase [Tatlockia sp.]|jgi:leader peptidase (prepilin peptidase)/N-methyltransferase
MTMITAFYLTHSPAAYVLLGLFSLAIGSLLNAVIYRLPLMMTQETSQVNLFFPRSFCPECKKTIPAYHNIPLLSFLLLRGRCSHCKKTIPKRYFAVEVLSLILALFAAWHFGFTLKLGFVLCFLWILIALFFIDLKHQLLPDSLTLGLLWIGLIANTQSLFTPLPVAVLSACGAYLALWFFINGYYLLTGKEGMGQGDFKLFAAFGAWFGFTQLPLILLLASFTGAILGLMYLKKQGKTRDTPIPFGPFLCFAGCISLFWGDAIVRWYIQYTLY